LTWALSPPTFLPAPVPPVVACAVAPAVIATAWACAPNSNWPVVNSLKARSSSKKMICLKA